MQRQGRLFQIRRLLPHIRRGFGQHGEHENNGEAHSAAFFRFRIPGFLRNLSACFSLFVPSK